MKIEHQDLPQQAQMLRLVELPPSWAAPSPACDSAAGKLRAIIHRQSCVASRLLLVGTGCRTQSLLGRGRTRS
jgi:hypothetical protein